MLIVSIEEKEDGKKRKKDGRGKDDSSEQGDGTASSDEEDDEEEDELGIRREASSLKHLRKCLQLYSLNPLNAYRIADALTLLAAV